MYESFHLCHSIPPFSQIEALRCPNGIEDWICAGFDSSVYPLICNIGQQNKYAVQVSNDVEYEWENGEREVNIFLSVFITLITTKL